MKKQVIAISGGWVDLFDLPRLKGRRRRAFAPLVLEGIRGSHAGEIPLRSIVVGPDTFVRLFYSSDPLAGGNWLLPRQIVADLPEPHFPSSLDSLAIHDRPPSPGERGYESYVARRQLCEGIAEPAE